MTLLRNQAVVLVTINVGLLIAGYAHAGSWQTNAPFGATLQGDLYTPTTPGASPAILVANHYCTGHASNAHGWFQSFADQYGFYIITPDAGKQCFDSSISRSGDRAAIVTMVNYVLSHTSADKSRVFSTGLSSGGCMTNTLLAIYPDVFAGGAAMPGFPAGLWPVNDTTCSKCGSTPGASDTGQHYADLVKGVFSWTGTRPCSAQWVGGGDQYNFNGWLPVVASEFQILGNLGSGSTGTGAPSGWTRTEYKDGSGNVRLQTNLGPTSQQHDLSNVSAMFGQVVTFLGLDKATGACGLTTTSGTGGASSSGGTSNTGGAKSTGGAPATGGMAASGGTNSATGGAKATGGALSTGGASAQTTGGTVSTSGGDTATGGLASATGGAQAAATGGTRATGGAFGNTGGLAHTATGGINATTGGASANNTNASNSGDTGSCSCRAAGEPGTASTPWLVGLLGITAARWRRRRWNWRVGGKLR